VTILLIAHNMGFLSSVADDVVVMAEGKVLVRGPLETVRAHDEVITAYLGATVTQSGEGAGNARA
jgi:ABC-type branched-subunit amino acid transport system ATPase component